MPLSGTGGLFDFSHMGLFMLKARGAFFSGKKSPRKIAPMEAPQAIYMPLMNDKEAKVDDIIVYRMGVSRFFFRRHLPGIFKKTRLVFGTSNPARGHFTIFERKMGILAIQGPLSEEISPSALVLFSRI
jgi:glycine cleavage system aminomethyltransferase T